MDARTATAIRCFVAALALGILADALLRVGPWGANAAVFFCAFAACLVAFAPAGRKWPAVPIALFGLFFVWRDAPVLKALDALAIAAFCATIVLPEAVARIARATFCNYTAALCDAFAGAVTGAPLMARVELGLRQSPSSPGAKQQWLRAASSSATGLVIAFPLLLLFGALFASADPAFREFARNALRQDWKDLAKHTLVITLVFWAVAGYLRVLVFNARSGAEIEPMAEVFRLDALAVTVPLALLNALFLSFVCVQFEYFFGGNALVANPGGPTYAEYARQGFFQLVTVAVLALLLLYVADWLNRGAATIARQWFRILAAMLIVLVYIVMASALHRMYLYYQAYGLTQLRFYTTTFMVWLAVVIALFAATVLTERRHRFLFAGVAAGWIAIVALHAINPDAIIARANIARMTESKPLDVQYLGRALSADSIPALLEARQSYAGAERDAIDTVVVSWLGNEGRKYQDVRNWNWAASYARSEEVRLEIDTWAKEAIKARDARKTQEDAEVEEAGDAKNTGEK